MHCSQKTPYRFSTGGVVASLLLLLSGAVLGAQESIDNQNEAIDGSLLPLYGGYRNFPRKYSWDTVLGAEQNILPADRNIREILELVRQFSQSLQEAGISQQWDGLSQYLNQRSEEVIIWELQRYAFPSTDPVVTRVGLVTRQQDGRWNVPIRIMQANREARMTFIVAMQDDDQWKIDDVVGALNFQDIDDRPFSPLDSLPRSN